MNNSNKQLLLAVGIFFAGWLTGWVVFATMMLYQGLKLVPK